MDTKDNGLDIMADLVRELSVLNTNLSRRTDAAASVKSGSLIAGHTLSRGKDTDVYLRHVNTLKMITDSLKEFGIHLGNNGYSYIIDAVLLIAEKNTLDIVLNKDVYPVLAYRYKTSSPAVIEHNIRNAIKTAYSDNENKPGINKMTCFRKRPTNKEFLIYLAELVWNRASESYCTIAS